MTGTWEAPGRDHSSRDDAAQDLRYWSTTRGYPRERVVLGVPFYGYCWGDACPYEGQHPYASLVRLFPETVSSDLVEAPGDGYVVSHNDQAAMLEKAELSLDYGGIMIWEMSQDTNDETSLFRVIRETLNSAE